jgi:hypothetical protein
MKREDFTYRNRPYKGTVSFRHRDNGGPMVLTGSWELRIYKNGISAPFLVGTVANGKIIVDAANGLVTRNFPATDFSTFVGYGSVEFIRVDIESKPLCVWPLRCMVEGSPFLEAYNSDLIVYSNNINVLVEGLTLQNLADQAAASVTSAMAAAGLYPALEQRVTKLETRKDFIDLRDWVGVDPTDNNDNSTYLQALFNQSAASGVRAYIPPGKWAVGSSLTLNSMASVFGSGQPGVNYLGNSSFLHFAHSNFGIVTSYGSKGGGIKDLGFYRTQPVPSSIPGVPWVPADHQWDIYLSGAQDIMLDGLMHLNSTQMIASRLGGGRISIKNVKGQAYKNGIDLSQVYDCDYLDEIHLWPFSYDNPNVHAYTRANLTAFSFGRIDNPKVGRLFTFGAKVAYNFGFQPSIGNDGLAPPGCTSKFIASVLGADNCTRGLVVGPTAITAEIYANLFYAESATSAVYGPGLSSNPMIEIEAGAINTRIRLDTCILKNTSAESIRANGAVNNRIDIGCYESLNVGSISGYEFSAAAGNQITFDRAPETSAAARYSPTSPVGSFNTPNWRTYAPAVASTTGAIGAWTVSASYRRVGKTVDVQAVITITTNGTGAGAVTMTLPSAARAVPRVGSGSELVVNGNILNIRCSGGASPISILTATNGYPGANSVQLAVQYQYDEP